MCASGDAGVNVQLLFLPSLLSLLIYLLYIGWIFSPRSVASFSLSEYISFKKHFFLLMSVENPRITPSNKVVFPLLCHGVVQTLAHTLSNTSTQRLRKSFSTQTIRIVS